MLMQEALKEGLRESFKERFKERRSKLEIMVDILSVARKGAKKTAIVYTANLNFKRLDRYIPYLEDRGLIEKLDSQYTTTEKGEEFLREYQMMKDILLT